MCNSSRNCCWPHKSWAGAQFGGKYFAHDIRVIRHAAHGHPARGDGGFCSADRNIKAKINREGIWIEKLEDNQASISLSKLRQQGEGDVVHVDLTSDERDSGPSF